MDKYLSELPKFFNTSVSNLCNIISESTSSPFSQRTFQAIKSGSSDMFHGEHIKQILKKFSLVDIETDLNDYKSAADLADKFAILIKTIKVNRVTYVDLILKDPIYWLSIYEEENPESKDSIRQFKTELLSFLNANSKDLQMCTRPSFRYTLFLYHLVCISFKITNEDIDAKYIKNALLKNDINASLLRRIISKLFDYSNEEIDNLSNKALAKISEKIKNGLKLSTFLQIIENEFITLEHVTCKYSILNDATNEIISEDHDFNDIASLTADKLDQINDDFAKSMNSLDPESNIKSLEDLWIMQYNHPLNTLLSYCITLCDINFQADLRLATDSFEMFSLLSKYGIDTSTIKDELTEYGPDYIVKHYYTCHKGYMWWQLYFERSYNRYFFPSDIIDDSITCKMLKP